VAEFGPEAEALHDARPEALDQHVGARREVERAGLGILALEVELGDQPVAAQQVEARCPRAAELDRLDAIDRQHLGAHVGQHHGAHRRRPDAGKLQDFHAGEGTAAAGLLC